MTADQLTARLLPEPQQLILGEGALKTASAELALVLPSGDANAACRQILEEAVLAAKIKVTQRTDTAELTFQLGKPGQLPALPEKGFGEAYALRITSEGISAKAATPRGLLYAAMTLDQLVRVCASEHRLPALTIVDWPEFRDRGFYIEGGQERFGHIVSHDYLIEQLEQAARLKLNYIGFEVYNVFPYKSFPACADESTLTEEEARDVVAAAHKWHVTLIPSLQTLAQAYELVWLCDEGIPYREPTAPGQTCPSTPEIYPFIKGLYRDLLEWFDEAPVLGVGCSEIDMQWQKRYCPKCQARLDAGETLRDLLIGHAEKCIQAVEELAVELDRPVRPLIWGDEFYMYGPATDWVGIERISKDTVIGFWKYWQDYAGIEGLMQRGYDVMGITGIYNHTFYFVDLSPETPKKSWPSMEETNGRNITELVQAADAARKVWPEQEFLGTATASFSKHRLRAFDSLWWGFALNSQCNWSHPERDLPTYQAAFTKAFVQHYYDAPTDASTTALASLWNKLDAIKSDLEFANQTLHDVVGVYDTQESGYIGNGFFSAVSQAAALFDEQGQPGDQAQALRERAKADRIAVEALGFELDQLKGQVGNSGRLADLRIAQQKIEAHLLRQLALFDTAQFTLEASSLTPAARKERALFLASVWDDQITRLNQLDRKTRYLYQRGDPLAFDALRRDVEALASYMRLLAQEDQAGAKQLLLSEDFATLDPALWLVRGEPQLGDGKLHTSATGGWDNYSGIATRQNFELDDMRPLLVEFTVNPIKFGIDSQIAVAADEEGKLTYHWSFYGTRGHFATYTRKSEPGLDQPWQLKGMSGEVEAGKPWRVRLTVGRTTFRVTVSPLEASEYALPFWDSGAQSMDALDSCHLLFADVEPPEGSASSEWSDIRIWRANAAD